jgi:integrase
VGSTIRRPKNLAALRGLRARRLTEGPQAGRPGRPRAPHVAEGEKPRSNRRKNEVKVLSPTQVRTLLSAARGTRNEALYVLAFHTRLRQGELLGLKWTDIDLETGKLSVTR